MREDRSVLDLLERRLHVRQRAAREALRHSEHLRPDFRRVPVPSDARRGLLGQGSMLTRDVGRRTAPRRCMRGKWILENLLGSPPPLPPPDVPPLLEKKPVRASEADVGARADGAAPRRIPCAPAATRSWTRSGWRSKTSTRSAAGAAATAGIPIDASGQLVDGTPIDGPASLRKALLGRPDAFVAAMTEKLLMYGVGRETKYYDMPAVRAIMRARGAAIDYRLSRSGAGDRRRARHSRCECK